MTGNMTKYQTRCKDYHLITNQLRDAKLNEHKKRVAQYQNWISKIDEKQGM
jgi:hypothetical protein